MKIWAIFIIASLALASFGANAQTNTKLLRHGEKRIYVCGEIGDHALQSLAKGGAEVRTLRISSLVVAADGSHKVCHAELGWLSPRDFERSFMVSSN